MLCDDEHMMLMQSSLQIQKKKCKLDRAILINSVYFNLYLLKACPYALLLGRVLNEAM